MVTSNRREGRLGTSNQDNADTDLGAASSDLIEGLRLRLTYLRRYGPEDAKDIVAECEKVLADTVRELNDLDIK